MKTPIKKNSSIRRRLTKNYRTGHDFDIGYPGAWKLPFSTYLHEKTRGGVPQGMESKTRYDISKAPVIIYRYPTHVRPVVFGMMVVFVCGSFSFVSVVSPICRCRVLNFPALHLAPHPQAAVPGVIKALKLKKTWFSEQPRQPMTAGKPAQVRERPDRNALLQPGTVMYCVVVHRAAPCRRVLATTTVINWTLELCPMYFRTNYSNLARCRIPAVFY